MTTIDETKKGVNPAENSPAPKTPEPVVPPVEVADPSEDAEFEKTLKDLESDSEQPQPVVDSKPVRSELEKATFTARRTLNRIKELGGDVSTILDDETAPDAPADKPAPAVDTSQFVTKADMLQIEAQKIAKSPNELKVIMWYVNNKGLSIEDAHFMANKHRIKKITGEITRTTTTVPHNGSGGAGQAPAVSKDAPDLPEADKKRLIASGMKYDPAKKAYIGSKIQHRYDEDTKKWVTERL